MPYGGVPTAREIITQKLADGSLQELFDAADTEESIRNALGICKPTWLQLKKEIPTFSSLCTRSRKQKFLEIKEALMKNARGFTYEENPGKEGQEPGLQQRKSHHGQYQERREESG